MVGGAAHYSVEQHLVGERYSRLRLLLTLFLLGLVAWAVCRRNQGPQGCLVVPRMDIPSGHGGAQYNDLIIFGLNPSRVGRATCHVVIVCECCRYRLDVDVLELWVLVWSLATVGV